VPLLPLESWLGAWDKSLTPTFVPPVSAHFTGFRLVALLYPELVNTCYAFDGQGIPPEMWKELEKLYGREKLDEIRVFKVIRQKLFI